MSALWTILLIVALLLIAAFCALAETAIARVGRAKAHHLAQEKGARGEILVKIVEDPAPFMNVVLFLTLLAHIAATVVATSYAIDRFGGTGEVIATAVMTIAIFVFAEVTPKTFTVQRTDRAALLMARPVYVLGKAL